MDKDFILIDKDAKYVINKSVTIPLQIGADGRRNQVFLALSTAAEFREHLSQFSDFYSNLGEKY